MKKAEMADITLNDLATFSTELGRAGWNVESWEPALDTGADVDPQAEATYSAPVFDMSLAYHAGGRFLTLSVVERDGEVALDLRLQPSVPIRELLMAITAVQDSLQTDTLPELVKSLIVFCTVVLVRTEEGFQRLSL